MIVQSEELVSQIRPRLEEVEERIARACARAHRNRQEVTVVAVTKTFPAEVVRAAYHLGLRHFGENYIQEFQAKRPEIGELEGAVFRFIGHLQSNKSAIASKLFDVVETVDDAKLARRLDAAGKVLDVFLEVKLGDEETKSGVTPDELSSLIETVGGCRNLRLQGLMVIPPWSEDRETSRPYFAKLYELAAKHSLPHLSMGMSNDFEAAIEEGATHVRVGTALFGRRTKKA